MLNMRPARSKETALEKHGVLQVVGNRIRNKKKDTVILRGVSLFWSQWDPKYFNASALGWLQQDWNIDVIRAPIAVNNGGYAANPEGEFQKLQAVIEAAVELGLYVIVDWHCHDPETSLAVAFFSRVSRAFGHLPNLIYELWNEPSDVYCWKSAIRGHHQTVLAAIREHDERNLAIASPQNWARDVDISANDPLDDRNLAYSLHFYAGTHGQALRDKVRVALNMNAPIFATEWGTSEASGDGRLDTAETQRWLRFLENDGISHVNWSISDRAESSAALKPGAAPEGGWSPNDLSDSGAFVRNILRRPSAHVPAFWPRWMGSSRAGRSLKYSKNCP